MRISIDLNGKKIIADNINPGQRLIDWLRNDRGLIGTKEGCGEGECGACTVLLDDKPVNSCLVLMGQVDGKKIATIEGIREQPFGKKLIDSFIKYGAIQCGFCTPGMVVASFPLLRENCYLTIDDIKMAISGNLCRCTGYIKIIKAIRQVIEECNIR